MIQITVGDFAHAAVHGSGFSPGATITWAEWCDHEARRIRAKGIKVEVRRDEADGRIALFADVPGAGKAPGAAQEAHSARSVAQEVHLPPQGGETRQNAPEGGE